MLALVCEVSTRALKAVWYQKFIGNLRLRPEAYAGLVHRALHPGGLNAAEAKTALGAGLAVLQNSASAATNGAVARVRAANQALNPGDADLDTYLLPMCFEEGSPTHGSYGAGHATVAGACVTVLKAVFQGSQKLVDLGLIPVVPSADGKIINALPAGVASQLTVEGELNKLASNIAIGRNMAGVHWRTDYSASILLGQRVATSMLYHQRRDYHERPWTLSYKSFGGKIVEIRQDRVLYDGSVILDGDDDLDPPKEAKKLAEIV